jgi:GAF domain-containing protein
MDSLLHAGQSMTSSLVVQDVLDAVAREVVDTFTARYCVIWEYVEDQDMLVERAGFSVDADYTVDDDFILLDERPREREILFSPGPVLETVSDPALDAESRESMERWGEKTCLSLPLRFGGATLGLLVICETERERRYSGEELDLARGLANQASAAVHNARVYRDLQERNVELVARSRRERLLNELSLELGASLDPRKVLDSACSRVCTILDATGCEIWAHEDDGTIECLAAWVAGEAVEEWIGRRLPVEDWGVTRVALEEGKTLVVTSLDDPRLGKEERAVMLEWDQRAAIATPLRARGRILGTLEITQEGRERDFTADEIATAEACARLTAPAIDNAILYERQADHAKRLQSLLVAGRAVTSSLVIEDVLAALVRTAATSLGTAEALIFEYSADADTLTMRSVYQEDPTVYQDLDKPYQLSEYPSDRELLESEDIVVETISDPDLPLDVRESMEHHGEKTCLTVPLRFGPYSWACSHWWRRPRSASSRKRTSSSHAGSANRRPWPCTTRTCSRT